MLTEAKLYPVVKEFLEKKLNCLDVFVEAGKQGIGSVDVFGVYYTNAERTAVETVGVEVKIDKIPISAKFGQAKGYTLFCDKMFFASLDKVNEKDKHFNQDDIEIAKHLGIGLIQIEDRGLSFVCKEVLAAPKGETIRKYSNHALRSKKVFACFSCKKIQHLEKNYTRIPCRVSEVSTYSNSTYIKNQVKRGKAVLVLGRDEFYCNTCAKKKLRII
jgi:hypothetical protein